MSDPVFEQSATFEQGELSGNVRLHRYEACYEQLFAEAMEDGVVTSEERARLDEVASSMGLDRRRLRQLEEALVAAYEARHGIGARVTTPAPPPDEDAPRPSLVPIEPAQDLRTLALERRIEELEARIAELEQELLEAHSHVAVEVDFSDLAGAHPETPDDPAELSRRLRHDPRDEATLRALYRAHGRAGDRDRQWLAAHVLVFLGAARADESAFYAERRPDGLIRPTASVPREAWRRFLAHPEEEALTGDIFAAVASAVLLGRVAALRHQKALPALDASKRQDPRTSTVQAVRCFTWAASTLGMSAPPLYADPGFPGLVEMVPGVPPSSRLGRGALSGRTPAQLAFLAGQHLAWYREERFVRLLVPGIPDLEDVFLAALAIGNPGLPMGAEVRRRVEPLAKAIEPVLEATQIDRLRGHFLRFVEEGGRTNLQRFASAADRTSARAGLLLANDLHVAREMLELEDPARADERMDDLLVFTTSDRYANLRRQIGVAAS